MEGGLHQLKSYAAGRTLAVAITGDTRAALGARDALQVLRELCEGLLGRGEISGLESSADGLKVLRQLA